MKHRITATRHHAQNWLIGACIAAGCVFGSLSATAEPISGQSADEAYNVTIPDTSGRSVAPLDATRSFALYVRFAPEMKVRALDGVTRSLEGADLSGPLSVVTDNGGRFIPVVRHDLLPAISIDGQAIPSRTQRLLQEVADTHRIAFDGMKSTHEMAAIGNALLAFPEVEFVEMAVLPQTAPLPKNGLNMSFTNGTTCTSSCDGTTIYWVCDDGWTHSHPANDSWDCAAANIDQE
ncbi:MAG: hypothetical protein WD397_14415 [Wenzhouxiangellaceae bacterium]